MTDLPLLEEMGRSLAYRLENRRLREEQARTKYDLEADLKESQSLLKAAVAHTPVVLWVVDKQGTIRLTDGEGLKLFGMKPGDLVGQNHFELYRDRPDLTEAVRRALSGEEFRVEQAIDGFHFEVFFTPIRDQAGNVTAMVGVTIDMTERKKWEDSLRAGIDARDHFLGLASHELKSPLRTVKLHAQLTAAKLGSGELHSPGELSEFLTMVNQQCGRLLHLVDDLLDLTRIRSGRLAISKALVDLGDLTEKIVNRHRPELEQAGCQISFKKNGLSRGLFDAERMEQVIGNLLSNITRHAAGCSVQVEVACPKPDQAQILILDTGPGIPLSAQQQVFDTYRLGKSFSRTGGLGLGLHLARQIVEAHGGSLTLQSEPGKGTKITIALPLGG